MSSTKKVRQIAKCVVVYLTDDPDAVERGLKRIADGGTPGVTSWYVDRKPGKRPIRFSGYTLSVVEISYSAKGANRYDIARRVANEVPAEWVSVSGAEITKLDV